MGVLAYWPLARPSFSRTMIELERERLHCETVVCCLPPTVKDWEVVVSDSRHLYIRSLRTNPESSPYHRSSAQSGQEQGPKLQTTSLTCAQHAEPPASKKEYSGAASELSPHYGRRLENVAYWSWDRVLLSTQMWPLHRPT